MRDGIDDENYQNIFVPIVSKVMESYQPSAIVLQCGADSLSGDRLGCFNLTLKGNRKLHWRIYRYTLWVLRLNISMYMPNVKCFYFVTFRSCKMSRIREEV